MKTFYQEIKGTVSREIVKFGHIRRFLVLMCNLILGWGRTSGKKIRTLGALEPPLRGGERGGNLIFSDLTEI